MSLYSATPPNTILQASYLHRCILLHQRIEKRLEYCKRTDCLTSLLLLYGYSNMFLEWSTIDTLLKVHRAYVSENVRYKKSRLLGISFYQHLNREVELIQLGTDLEHSAWFSLKRKYVF